MFELPSLFAHQQDFRDRLRAALSRHGRVIGCAQAGFGKTRVSKWILGTAANREPSAKQSGRSLFAVYSRGLVDNASDSFNETAAVPHGVLMSGKETHYGRRIQIGSIDSMLSWFIKDGAYSTDMTFDLIVYDEADAHHPKFARFLSYHDEKRARLGLNPAYVIGLTATPQAKGLSDVYKDIILGPPTSWLIANGFLVPFRYFRATQGKLGLLVKRGNTFTEASEAAAMEGLSGELLRDWQKFAAGRATIGFFPRRSHAKDAMARLESAGLRVAYVDGDTEDIERKTIFSQLNHHQIDYICNVRVIGRGTDIPRADCVQLCVATGSVAAYRQYVGRVSRTHPDKKDAIVIDHGANVLRHGFFDDDPQWSLDRTEKDAGEQGTRPTIECPRCQAIYRGGKCRSCGYEPSQKERRGQGLEFDGTELKEVKREEAKSVKVKSAEQLMVQALYAAGRSGRTWRQCCGIFNGLCKKQGSEYRIPGSVEIGGHRYNLVRAGSDDGGRRVGDLYPFTVSRGGHGGAYLLADSHTTGSAW